jgi:aryl-alcohol dehydrogenase-like predicted oxidoreductase
MPAVIGASRPEQVTQNAEAAAARLEDAVLTPIDEILGDVVVRDPARIG